MKAFGMQQVGTLDNVQQLELPDPSPEPYEVVIKIAYASVNNIDWKLAEGLIENGFKLRFPLVLGWDCSGHIAQVGEHTTHFNVGDPVMAYILKEEKGDGTFAEAIAVEERAVAHAPHNLELREAVTLATSALTPWQALFQVAQLEPGEEILIHGGAGAVGGFAIQFAKWRGAKVYTTASLSNHAYVLRLGADVAIDYRSEDFVAVIGEHSPNGVDVVLDAVGGETQERSWDVLKSRGRLVSLLPLEKTAQAHLGQAKFWFVQPSGLQMTKIATLAEAGRLQLPEIHELPFDQAQEALRLRKNGSVRGKVILAI